MVRGARRLATAPTSDPRVTRRTPQIQAVRPEPAGCSPGSPPGLQPRAAPAPRPEKARGSGRSSRRRLPPLPELAQLPATFSQGSCLKPRERGARNTRAAPPLGLPASTHVPVAGPALPPPAAHTRSDGPFADSERERCPRSRQVGPGVPRGRCPGLAVPSRGHPVRPGPAVTQLGDPAPRRGFSLPPAAATEAASPAWPGRPGRAAPGGAPHLSSRTPRALTSGRLAGSRRFRPRGDSASPGRLPPPSRAPHCLRRVRRTVLGTSGGRGVRAPLTPPPTARSRAGNLSGRSRRLLRSGGARAPRRGRGRGAARSGGDAWCPAPGAHPGCPPT